MVGSAHVPSLSHVHDSYGRQVLDEAAEEALVTWRFACPALHLNSFTMEVFRDMVPSFRKFGSSTDLKHRNDFSGKRKPQGIQDRDQASTQALTFLGISPSEEQKHLLRSQIQIDARGTVAYGDFVRVSKQVFNLHIEDRDLEHLLRMSEDKSLLELVSNQMQSCDLSEEKEELDKVREDRDDAYAQLRVLKERLLESEKQKNRLADELSSVKQEVKAAVEETRALRSRIHLAEMAQRQACGVEQDYEEVIRLLEAEIAELKSHVSGHSGQSKDSEQDLKRRITVLDCQLRKSEVARKTFEVSTEKLLQFVENVHKVFADDTGSTLNLCERISTLSSQPPRLNKTRPMVAAAIAAEAKELSRSIRSIIEVDCLPYGWEEAYTADGIKYFINHVTETTSWTHPVASALSLTYPEDSGEESPRPGSHLSGRAIEV
ncbi:syntaxin-binding protein 4 [Gastrophryne carolinensis]